MNPKIQRVESSILQRMQAERELQASLQAQEFKIVAPSTKYMELSTELYNLRVNAGLVIRTEYPC